MSTIVKKEHFEEALKYVRPSLSTEKTLWLVSLLLFVKNMLKLLKIIKMVFCTLRSIIYSKYNLI